MITPNPRFTRHFFARFSDNTVEKLQPNFDFHGTKFKQTRFLLNVQVEISS
jgi:hypothetical protein